MRGTAAIICGPDDRGLKTEAADCDYFFWGLTFTLSKNRLYCIRRDAQAAVIDMPSYMIYIMSGRGPACPARLA